MTTMTVLTMTALRGHPGAAPWLGPTRARQLARGPAGGAIDLWRWLEIGALVYIITISAGALGFVDVVIFGDAFRSVSESAFAGALWPIAYLAFGLLVLRHRDQLMDAVQAAWWVLPFPFLVIASFAWSIDPAATMNAAVRIGMTTVIGVYIGTRFDLRTLVETVFWVLMAAVGGSVLAILAGLDFAFAWDGGPARGLFHHKNTFGSRSALLMVAAAALLFTARRPFVAAVGIGVGAFALVLSNSAAGLALGVVALIAAPLVLLLRGAGLSLFLRLLILGAIGTAAALALVLLRIDPVTDGLEALGRDATLTGRVILWEAAIHNIAERPFLGTGFAAYWSTGPDWRTLIAFSELGNVLHFHNSFLELLVQLGMLGAAAGLALIVGYARNAAAALRGYAEPGPWPALFGLVVLALGVVEHELFVQHNLFHILILGTTIAARPPALLLNRPMPGRHGMTAFSSPGPPPGPPFGPVPVPPGWTGGPFAPRLVSGAVPVTPPLSAPRPREPHGTPGARGASARFPGRT